MSVSDRKFNNNWCAGRNDLADRGYPGRRCSALNIDSCTQGMLTILTKREKEARIFAEPIVDITILPQASGDLDKLVMLIKLNVLWVAVNDDESRWKSSYGVNVIKGMLGLPGEYKHHHHRHESVHIQKQLVANFERGSRSPGFPAQFGPTIPLLFDTSLSPEQQQCTFLESATHFTLFHSYLKITVVYYDQSINLTNWVSGTGPYAVSVERQPEESGHTHVVVEGHTRSVNLMHTQEQTDERQMLTAEAVIS
ncbi:CWF19-like protein 2 [Artemisia annua]|uniref:CWF19-like protein 2 n=1 Tax=Artemisia annua TaxID=35608 RepID=A0A2U1KWV1_ARTAN|nr:CWF19-like protein 2 [Artemisia annua]